jgi:hypothetical protein
MNRNLKIVLFTLAGLLLLCGLSFATVGLLASRVFKGAFDPAQAAAVGAQIADYTVPAGYTQTVGFTLGPFKAVTLLPDTAAPTGDEMMFMLHSVATGGAKDPELQKQLKATMDQQGTRTGDLVIIDQKAVTVRGHPGTLSIYEDQGVGDAKVRQVVVSFDGKGGPAMLTATGKMGRWRQALLDELLASMR